MYVREFWNLSMRQASPARWCNLSPAPNLRKILHASVEEESSTTRLSYHFQPLHESLRPLPSLVVITPWPWVILKAGLLIVEGRKVNNPWRMRFFLTLVRPKDIPNKTKQNGRCLNTRGTSGRKPEIEQWRTDVTRSKMMVVQITVINGCEMEYIKIWMRKHEWSLKYIWFLAEIGHGLIVSIPIFYCFDDVMWIRSIM